MRNLVTQKFPPAERDSLGTCHLTLQQIQMIEEALLSLGDYGEVRLIMEKGRLRFLVTQKSVDINKWKPGDLVDQE